MKTIKIKKVQFNIRKVRILGSRIDGIMAPYKGMTPFTENLRINDSDVKEIWSLYALISSTIPMYLYYFHRYGCSKC